MTAPDNLHWLYTENAIRPSIPYSIRLRRVAKAYRVFWIVAGLGMVTVLLYFVNR